jgi:cell division initiation protein
VSSEYYLELRQGGLMPLTPDEIRHIELPRTGFRGYRRKAVDALLSEIADSFDAAQRDHGDLLEYSTELEGEASKQKELEALLRSTLVSAERAAQDMKEQARRESDLIVQEAHAEGRRVTRQSVAEIQRLEEETRKIRALLRSALEVLDERPLVREGEGEGAEPAQAEETREAGIRKVVG